MEVYVQIPGTPKSTVLRPRPLLLAVTAAGPVYKGSAEFVLVPITSVMATLQELARRIFDGAAPVQSSLAGRVSGSEAHTAWLSMSVQAAGQLQHLSARGRLRFLRIVIAYIKRSGHSNGLETLYLSAVNAAWPWLSLEACNHVLELTHAWLQKSEVARKSQVAVVDVTQRTVGTFGAGELVNLDLSEWRSSRALELNETGDRNFGDALDEVAKSPLERAIDQLFGGDTSQAESADSLLHGNDASGVPGGLPSLGDLPGRPKNASGRSQSLEDKASDLLGSSKPSGIPGGLPDIASLPGKRSDTTSSHADPGQALIDAAGLGGLSGFLREHGTGGFRTGIFNGATPGGPYAPPGQLPSDGSGGETPLEDKEAAATKVAAAAMVMVAVAGPTTAVGYGFALVAAAAAGFALGIAVPIAIFGNPEKPKPPKDSSHQGDLYPDPMGEGGGNPAQLPVDDTDLHGHPTRLPDSDGHGGGTPNTIFGKSTEGTSIWDDNFGRPGPTVKPETFNVTMVIGPGLMADVVQIGRSTIRY